LRLATTGFEHTEIGRVFTGKSMGAGVFPEFPGLEDDPGVVVVVLAAPEVDPADAPVPRGTVLVVEEVELATAVSSP
jgi:hypothetical protein